MALRIPRTFQRPLADLIAMRSEDRQQLIDTIRAAPAVQDRAALAARIASETALDKERAAGIVSMLMSLYRVIQDTPIDEFVGDVCEAVRTSARKETKEVDWSSFKQDLTALLSSNETFGVMAKAHDIQKQQAHVYCNARILTDIRPVFKKDPADGPTAAFVTHTLRISTHDQGDFSTAKDFFVSLDADDLKELRRLVDRAVTKEEALKSLLHTAKVACLELEGHH